LPLVWFLPVCKAYDDDNRRGCVLVFSPGYNMGQMPVNIILGANSFNGTAVHSVE